MKTIIFRGKKIAYDDKTEFYVQVGKNKSKYLTKYKSIGAIDGAVIFYSKLEVSDGFKKRLYVPSLDKPTLAREKSEGRSGKTLREFVIESNPKDDSHAKV